MRRVLLALVACLGILTVAACEGRAPSAPKTSPYAEPHWQDVFEGLPELLVLVRPGGLRQDKVYGPLLRGAIDMVRERSKVVAATRALDAMEDAEEVVIGARGDTRDGPGEFVVVVQGVRADIDPAKLVDSDGRTLWGEGPTGRVRELVRERDDRGEPIAASLFELPGRTWVIATGEARARARDAFAHPFNRPMLELDPRALAIVRIDGPALVAHVRAFQPHGALDAVGRKLQSTTLTLPPGGEGSIRATLSYEDEDAAAFAEISMRQAIEAVVASKRERLAWLRTAKVERPDRRVTLTAPLPPQLVDALLRAGTVPLDIDIPPP